MDVVVDVSAEAFFKDKRDARKFGGEILVCLRTRLESPSTSLARDS